MDKRSRTYNSVVNSAVGIISAIFNVVLNFFVRIVIVRVLGEEINGLHSLFQNIINILAIIETSMCTAMIIHLYGPIKNDDVNELSEILSLYNRIYKMLALFFFGVSLIMNFFLESLITTSVPMINVHIYFFIFTLSLVISYLTYTYRIVLFAEQKNRISAIATLFSEIIFRGGAAFTAIYFKSYALFLFCFIGEKLLGNLLCKYYVQKKHFGVTCKSTVNLNTPLYHRLIATVKPLLISRIADIVQNSSQSILISLLLGNIAIVGYYGNYALVVGSVGLLFSQLGAAFTSSFGSLATELNHEKMYNAYRKSDFIMTSIAIVICSGFLACIQDFISLAFGINFLLQYSSVFILTVSMFVTLLNIPCISVQNAMGRHDLDVKNMLIQAFLSVVFGYIGGSIWGMEGLLTGMLIPLVIFTTILKNILIGKEVFRNNLHETLIPMSTTIIKGLCIFLVVIVLTSVVKTESLIINILVKGVLSLMISIPLLVLLSIKNQYFKNLVKQFRGYIKI